MLLRSFVLSIIALSLTACNISGLGEKGPFKAGSAVTISKLDDQANPLSGVSVNTQTKTKQGFFSTNSVKWSGWTEVQVTGLYFDEYSNSDSTASMSLNAITKKDKTFDIANVNLLTHLASARIKQQVANGESTYDAWKSTQVELKQLFGLSKVGLDIHSGVEQLSLSRGSGRFQQDNANLLLFTGSFLATGGNATSLQTLSDDFADDGQFNGAGESTFNAIASKASTEGLLTTLSQNLKNHGARNPPNNGDMSELPVWVITDSTPVNHAPVANAQSVTVDEDTANNPITLTGTDADGDSLTYTHGQPSHGTLSGSGENLTYTPTPNYFGADSFTFTVNDGTDTSTEATVTITVNDVPEPNTAPVANAQSVIVDEDTANNPITLTGTDADGDNLTYTHGQPSNGTLSGSGENLTYTPTPNYFGADSFTFTVNDGTDTSTEATVTITVNDVPEPNTAPVANAQSVIVDEDTANNPITLTGTDADNDDLTYTHGQPSHGTLSGSGENITYTPTPNFYGADSFTFTVNDGTDTSTEAIVTITVNDVAEPNTAPVALDQEVTLEVDSTGDFITMVGEDADGDILTFTTTSSPSNGTLSSQGGLSATTAYIKYTPNAGFIGLDTFTFKVNDGINDSASSATVTINVEAPEALITIEGFIMEAGLAPISGANVNVYKESILQDGTPVITDANGAYSLINLEVSTSYTLVIEHDGFTTQIKNIATTNAPTVTLDIVMIPRQASQTINIVTQTISSSGVTEVVIPANTFTSSTEVVITTLEQAVQAKALPGSTKGDFTNEIVQSTFDLVGMAEFSFINSATNEVIDVSLDRSTPNPFQITVPLHKTKKSDGSSISVGDSIPLLYLNEKTGNWVQDGIAIVSEDMLGNLSAKADVYHFTWWSLGFWVPPQSPYIGTVDLTLHSGIRPPGATDFAVIRSYVEGDVLSRSIDAHVDVNTSINVEYSKYDGTRSCFWADIHTTGGQILTSSIECISSDNATKVEFIGLTLFYPSYYPDDTFISQFGQSNSGALLWQDNVNVANSLYPLEGLNGARTYCSNLNFAGSTNWRLPTAEDYQGASHVVSSNATYNTPEVAGRYWTGDSTPTYVIGSSQYSYPRWPYQAGGTNISDTAFLGVRCVKSLWN